MEEKFKHVFKKALGLVNLEIKNNQSKGNKSGKDLRLKLLAELLKEQVPHENSSYTAR